MQLLRKIGFPIALVYGLVVYLRNYLFDIGFFRAVTFKTHTICVGNLSVGGTGKTPMIEYLIAQLKDTHKIAVLSRGYGRKSKGFVLARPTSTVKELGDEPFQIYSKFSDIVVAVDTDRREGISLLERDNTLDIILLDDAYQHRRVKPSLSILLTVYGNLYCDDWYLPMGNLRDGKKEAKRADLIVVTKCPAHFSDKQRLSITNKLSLFKNQQIVFSTLAYNTILKGYKEELTLAGLKGKKITLVTGIASPDSLLRHLEKQGVIFEHLSFRDHHFFTEKEIRIFNTKELLLTTEKDFVRLNGRVNKLCYIEVKHQFLFRGKKTLNTIISKLSSIDVSNISILNK